MQYKGIDCPVCSEKFADGDDVVVCPVCGTPHHRNCWRENGGCKNEEKHLSGFVWQNPDIPQPVGIPQQNSGENCKICPRCGEKNAPYEPVCTRCGERLKANRQTISDSMPDFNRQPFPGYGENPNPNNFSPYQNVYAADARTVYGEDAAVDGIPVTEIAEYVQRNSNKYVGNFLDMQEKKTKLKWNWSAAIFSVFWCFYRKMMACGLMLIAVLFSVSLLSSFIPRQIYQKYQPEVYEEYVECIQEINKEMSEALSGGINAMPDNYYNLMLRLLFSPIMLTSYIIQICAYLIAALIFGFFGNHFYKKKVVRDILALRQVAVDSMSYHIYIRQRGGVSYANIILPVLCNMILNMALSYF